MLLGTVTAIRARFPGRVIGISFCLLSASSGEIKDQEKET